jgi:CRP/FNR family transcriptional regulator
MTAFVPDSHVARLPSITILTDAQAEQGFIDEGEPAACFFNITVGSAKLFKLLSDGRRKNTGFVAPGQFIGRAVSDTYAFSAGR